MNIKDSDIYKKYVMLSLFGESNGHRWNNLFTKTSA